MVGVCLDGESGGRFPIVRPEHLLGLIGRSHSPDQAQAEEREERRRLDWEHSSPPVSGEVNYISIVWRGP